MTRSPHAPKRTRLLPLVLIAAIPTSCSRTEPPGSDTSDQAATAVAPGSAETTNTVGGAPQVALLGAAGNESSAAGTGNQPAVAHPGPWLTILQPSVAIYSEPSADRANKLGYAQSGAKVAVTGKPKPGDKCNAGWIQVVPIGYICAGAGTLDETDSRVRFTLKPPALDKVLPHTYARNAKNGTPLYRSIPTRKQMLEYEPYLRKDTSPPSGVAGAPSAPAAENVGSLAAATVANAAAASLANVAAGGAGPRTGDVAAPAASNEPTVEDTRPWWQQDGIEDRLHEIRLSDLQRESDDVLALRMVKGFYVAIDRTFHWHGRTWYKTTKGLVAPADRMGQASPSDFKGVELNGDWHLPVGWVYGGREKATVYEIDLEKNNRVRPAGSVPRFEALQLTERTVEVGGANYRELSNGKWIRKEHIRVPEPGEPPKELAERERWLDVDLSSQTLVVFEGTTPIYATLISSGRSSKIKEKDHATPTGQWRIREKHITTTMDGDGSAAGDLPYSIEDVPFVMYFHKSYAVHGAFWHRNYGVQMSHGCLNMSPLDAKAVFYKTEPALPDGWHGAWSGPSKPGSWVVVHE